MAQHYPWLGYWITLGTNRTGSPPDRLRCPSTVTTIPTMPQDRILKDVAQRLFLPTSAGPAVRSSLSVEPAWCTQGGRRRDNSVQVPDTNRRGTAPPCTPVFGTVNRFIPNMIKSTVPNGPCQRPAVQTPMFRYRIDGYVQKCPDQGCPPTVPTSVHPSRHPLFQVLIRQTINYGQTVSTVTDSNHCPPVYSDGVYRSLCDSLTGLARFGQFINKVRYVQRCTAGQLSVVHRAIMRECGPVLHGLSYI